MSILEMCKSDVEFINSNTNDFSVLSTLRNSDNSINITVKGIHAKHHLGITPEGVPINTRVSNIAFTEKQVTDHGKSIRNSFGEVDLNGFTITVKDSTGLDKTYAIEEWYPDETVGLIVCILGKYE